MKKYFNYALAAFFAVLFLSCSSMTVSASKEKVSSDAEVSSETSVSSEAETNAAEVEKAKRVSITVKNVDGDKYYKLTDRDYYTKYEASSETTFNVKGKSEFTGLYVVFDKPCEWKVTLPDGTELSGGKEGFIHEYMPLGQSVTDVVFTIPKKAVLCDIYALSEGELPSWVQIWELPCEEADLLLLPTHADDEYLWFGGAMPYYAGELGYNVQVAYMTNHASQPYRSHERLNGLWTVGVTHYPVIADFVDVYRTKASFEAAEKEFGLSNVIQWHVEMIRRFKPKVIIGHDINGEYGHGAHKLNTKALLEAVKISNDPESCPQSAEQYGAYEVQKCYIHLWPENQIQVEWGDMVLSKFDGKTALKVASEGFACHQSQVKYFNFNVYSKRYDCRKFGLAYTSVGLDTEGTNDMFENVVWPQPEPEPEEIVSESDIVSDSDNADASGSRFPVEWIAVGICATGALVILVMIIHHCIKRRKHK